MAGRFEAGGEGAGTRLVARAGWSCSVSGDAWVVEVGVVDDDVGAVDGVRFGDVEVFGGPVAVPVGGCGPFGAVAGGVPLDAAPRQVGIDVDPDA